MRLAAFLGVKKRVATPPITNTNCGNTSVDSDYGSTAARLESLPAPKEFDQAKTLSAEAGLQHPCAPTSTDTGKRRMEEFAAALQCCAKGISNENLQALALDRLQGIRQDEALPEARALEAVDFWGELNRMRPACAGDDQRCLIHWGELFLQALNECRGERQDSDSWQPDIQRAIEIDMTLPPGSELKIAAKFGSGLCVRGCLVRKQGVPLLKPNTTTMNTLFDGNSSARLNNLSVTFPLQRIKLQLELST